MTSKMLNSRPTKMWIDGKIFDIQKLNRNVAKLKKKLSETASIVEQGKTDLEPVKLLEIDEDNGKFRTSFRLPKLYYAKIRNLPDFSIQKLSEDTKTEILLPKTGQDGEITVHSDDRDGILEAVKHIHSAVGEIRERNIPLQFVCIPCMSEHVRERFEHLKSEILDMQGEIDDEREKAEAIKSLNDYKSTFNNVLNVTGPLKLNISGLNVMNDNVKKVDVLYANVKMVEETAEHNLQAIVNDIATHFYNRGLAKRHQDNVRLHMTVINTKYRKEDSPKRKRRRRSIDATQILDKFKDYSFGDCDFDSLHLSHMSVRGGDGFYKPLAVIKFNSS